MTDNNILFQIGTLRALAFAKIPEDEGRTNLLPMMGTRVLLDIPNNRTLHTIALCDRAKFYFEEKNVQEAKECLRLAQGIAFAAGLFSFEEMAGGKDADLMRLATCMH